MDQRMIEFIRALRAAGIRISLAESQDAMNGVDEVGIIDPESFRMALKTTLVKERQDQPLFDYFFPLFFKSNQPPLQNITEQLDPEQQQMLQEAMQALAGKLDALRQLMQRLMDGRSFSDEELDQMARQTGLNNADEMYQRGWFERRMNRQAGLAQLEKWLDELIQKLEEMGMSPEALQELEQMMRENLSGLSEQVSQYVGTTLAEQMSERPPDPKPDLLDVPFSHLNHQDVENIRDEIRRLAARLRSRAALRQKKAREGTFDPRRTFRSNMRYGGVPMEMKFRTRHKKPSLVLICDVSTSVRYCAEFLLTLVYELQDQVRRTNSFIFIADLKDISMAFNEYQPQEAVIRVLAENPPGHYNTDLGNSLDSFSQNHMGLIDHRTTVIMLGDGRNNYNNPRLDIAKDMQRRSRRLIWFCPEPRFQWGSGDSDMIDYAANADGVHIVNCLRDLANAVDSILADGG